MARGVPETTTPAGRRAAAGEGRAHNRDRTGDLILTKDVLCRLSYVSDLLNTLPYRYAPRLTRCRRLLCESYRPDERGTMEPKSGRRDSNPRHQAWKASALPTELLPRTPMLPAILTSGPAVVGEGFEPSKACADRFTVCSRWPLEYPTGALSDVPLRARLPSFERADGRD